MNLGNVKIYILFFTLVMSSLPAIGQPRFHPVQLEENTTYKFLFSCDDLTSNPLSNLKVVRSLLQDHFGSGSNVEIGPKLPDAVASGGIFVIGQRRDFFLASIPAKSMKEGLARFVDTFDKIVNFDKKDAAALNLFDVFEYLQMTTGGQCDILVPTRFYRMKLDTLLKDTTAN